VSDVDEVAPAALVSSMLDAEAERIAAQNAADDVDGDDDVRGTLPGVGGGGISLSAALKEGGVFTFVVLLLLNSLDELESAALAVLAPDIRDTFGVGNGVIVFVSAAAGGFVVLGALPMGWLADNCRRSKVVGFASVGFAACVFLSGLAINAFTLVLARFGVGIAKSNTLPVHGSLIADAYPIGARGRINATTVGTGQAIAVLSPFAVGGIAALAGGTEGWRWAFLLLGIPVMVVALAAFRIPEPPRGQYEMLDVVGEVIHDPDPAPISIEAAFARLWRIKTLKTVIVAFATLGFGLFTGPVLANLYVEDRFGLDAFERGLLGTLGGLGVVVILPFASRRYDALYKEDPAKALRLVGLLIIPVSVLIPIQYLVPSAIAFGVIGIVPTALLMTAFTMVAPIATSVVPYRLRGFGAALAAIYIFFIGATGGAVIAAFLADATSPQVAVITLMAPACAIGGLLILRSASFIRQDLGMVADEITDEKAAADRRLTEPDAIPAIEVRDVDFHYGPVQVLFDVGFEVRRGEVLALLGTNGAGKSTILRIIAGLGTPSRGVVRLDGRPITYVTPAKRAAAGMHLLAGGKGTFRDMTIRENLEMGAFAYRHDHADVVARIERVLDLFPALADRQHQLAGSLSGGQQQMLALAVVLLHDPDVLLIDELSLGLAPVVVQDLLSVIERLKSSGTTMVIVEQSLNVALSIADRAVFLEKGQVRFEGSARELSERDDLARAVFLGAEGG
jgi:ABC-type branched-subunit amino acid transport system ATPase component/predicted MFS family arabinose efflux permease